MKVTNFTTVASAIENGDFIEIYNAYAVWIKDNMWAWKTGSSPATSPLHLSKRTNGLTAFAKQHYNFQTESDIKTFQGQASKFLSNYPELLKEQADIFAATFPTVIKLKIKKKEQEEKITNSVLNHRFNIENTTQMELPVNETSNKISSNLSELAQTICAFAERGAKSIKSPDGWEVQF